MSRAAEHDEPPLFSRSSRSRMRGLADAPVDVAGLSGRWAASGTLDERRRRAGRLHADRASDPHGPPRLDDRRRAPSGIEATGRRCRRSRPRGGGAAARWPRLPSPSIAFEGSSLTSPPPSLPAANWSRSRGSRDLLRPAPAALLRRPPAENAAVAIAAVETFIGSSTQEPTGDVSTRGFRAATSRASPGGRYSRTPRRRRAQPRHGAASLPGSARPLLTSDQQYCAAGVLAEKDAEGILRAPRRSWTSSS